MAAAYLQVDRFLGTLVDARALASALELGLVDTLLSGPRPAAALGGRLGIPERGLALLLGLLEANGVVASGEDGVGLTAAFRDALAFRDLLEEKLAFLALVLPDVAERFTDLVARPDAFMAGSRVFELFRYDRCLEVTPENVAATRRWMRFTTALTRYEAEACLEAFPFHRHRRLLDVGGNSGELALRVCRACPGLRATVLDLPVVCAIGREHVAGEPEAGRIRFAPADARRDDLPGGHDLVVFKSVLHDWPDEGAAMLLARAASALEPGGSLVIFERGPLVVGAGSLPFWMIPNLLFLHFLRPPDLYLRELAAHGFEDATWRQVALEMPFHLITARKPGG